MPDTNAAETNEIVSMEDEMSALFDEIQSREENEPEEKPERARAPDGKFVKAEDKEEEPEKSPKPEKTKAAKAEKPLDVVTEEQPETVTETPASDVKPTELVRPPSSWSAVAKAKFAAMDPDVQKEVLKREDDFHKGIEGYKAKAQFADSIYREIQPFEAMIRSQGSTPEVSIRNLLGVAYQLSTGSPQQKQQVIAQIAQMYGVQMPQGEEIPQIDPTVATLQQEVQRLRQEREQEKYQRETSTTASLSDEIAAFQADPKNLYFENVRAHMSALLQGGRATGLQDAYDQAIWANPEVRQQLIAQQQKDAEAKRLEEAKKTAIDAKRSAGINTRPKSGIASTAPAGKTIVDTMNSVYDDIMSRT